MSAVQESAGCQVIVFKKNSEPNSDCKQLFFFVIANDWVMAWLIRVATLGRAWYDLKKGVVLHEDGVYSHGVVSSLC